MNAVVVARNPAGTVTERFLELFPIRCTHLIDKEMRRNKEIERVFRSYLIGIRSSHVASVHHLDLLDALTQGKRVLGLSGDGMDLLGLIGVSFRSVSATHDDQDGVKNLAAYRQTAAIDPSP